MTYTSKKSTEAQSHHPDIRDRLIVALYAQLKTERETREAMEWVARHGGLSPEVLEAMASDPVPAIFENDVAAVEKLIERKPSEEN